MIKDNILNQIDKSKIDEIIRTHSLNNIENEEALYSRIACIYCVESAINKLIANYPYDENKIIGYIEKSAESNDIDKYQGGIEQEAFLLAEDPDIDFSIAEVDYVTDSYYDRIIDADIMEDMDVKNMTKEEYIKFIYNKDNIMNCENCPHNKGFDNHNDRKPCGQYNCWVTIHTREDD